MLEITIPLGMVATMLVHVSAMKTLTICFVCFVSKFSKLQIHI
jgi:hypothetical protein